MNRTKHAIVATFWQLLEEKTYNKITVQDIVDRCHVNEKPNPPAMLGRME